MRVRFVPQAREELMQATAHYQDQSNDLAERFLADVAGAIDLLQQFPGIGPPITGNVRRLLLRTFPYQLVYRLEGDDIRVFAVAHLKRRPGYWRKRLR